MDRKIASIAIVAVALIIVAGAIVLIGDNGGDDTHKVVIKDSLGNDVEVTAPVTSFCTVNTNAAEFFQMLSIKDMIVGADKATISSLDTYKNVTNIGEHKNPVGEKIAETGSKSSSSLKQKLDRCRQQRNRLSRTIMASRYCASISMAIPC